MGIFWRLIFGAILVQPGANHSGLWCNLGAIALCGAIKSDAFLQLFQMAEPLKW
jgi:hypothetical protein